MSQPTEPMYPYGPPPGPPGYDAPPTAGRTGHRRWLAPLVVGVLVGVVALLLGMAIGAAGRPEPVAGPAAGAAPTAGPEPAETVTVEVPGPTVTVTAAAPVVAPAPEEAPPSTEEFLTAMLELAWDEQTPTDQAGFCDGFAAFPDTLYTFFVEAVGQDVPRPVFDDFFAAKCA